MKIICFFLGHRPHTYRVSTKWVFSPDVPIYCIRCNREGRYIYLDHVSEYRVDWTEYGIDWI